MYGHPVFRRGVRLAIDRHGCDRDSGFPALFELYKIIETCLAAFAFHTIYNGIALSFLLCGFGPLNTSMLSLNTG